MRQHRRRRQRGRQDAGPPSAADGGRSLRELDRAVGRGREPRHEAAAGGPARMPALWGWAGAGPGRAGGDYPKHPYLFLNY